MTLIFPIDVTYSLSNDAGGLFAIRFKLPEW